MLSIGIFHRRCAVKTISAFAKINVERYRPLGFDGLLLSAQPYPGMTEGGSPLEISTASSPGQPEYCRRTGFRSTVSPINK